MYKLVMFSGSPKEFMIEQLESLAKARASRVDYPCLFDESNIQSVAQMMDPTGRGYITLAQYKEGTLVVVYFLCVCVCVCVCR